MKDKFILIFGWIILLIGLIRSLLEFIIHPYPESIYLTTILSGIAFIYISNKLGIKK